MKPVYVFWPSDCKPERYDLIFGWRQDEAIVVAGSTPTYDHDVFLLFPVPASVLLMEIEGSQVESLGIVHPECR